MSLTDRISALTPEQRALFEKLRETQRKAASAPKAPPIPRVTGPTAEGDWPLSLDQERYWFMEQLYPDGAGLNITAATRMRGPLAPPVIAAALSEITRRHAAWRTVFPARDGRPVQRVLEPRPLLLRIVDLSALPAARREAESARLVGEASVAPFDLELGPLVRSVLVRMDPEDHLCLLTIHHLVTDFISSHLAWTELAALYGTLAAGGRPALPAPPVQYPDFAVWQREWLRGEVLEELAAWWRQRLDGFPPVLDLPADRPRPAEALALRGGRLPFTVGGELTDGLRALARQEGATLFMQVLAVAAALLHRDSGQERLILGANNANRNRPEIEPVLGCFLTQVPFPIDLAGDPPFRELLARVRQSALGSYAHQDLPFGQLVQAIGLERDPSRPPLIQTLVQVLDGQYSTASLPGTTAQMVDAWDGRARYDLMLTLFEYPGGLDGALEYDADLFDPATTVRRVERFLLLAAAAVADPDLPLSALPLLTPAARHQIACEWGGSALPPPGWTAPGRFAVQAARAPEALAVTAPGGTLTYGELDRRSAALARRLRAMGVGPESRVALLLDRTLDVPVAIFGVWKAGGAYVPLDLDAPPVRLADLLADAGPAVVIHRGPLPVPLAEGVRPLDLAAAEPDGAGPEEGLPPLPEVRPGQLAYLIYTSGTTGRPKAVMVEHGSLAAFLGAFIDHVALGPGDRVAGLTRYTFDPSLLDVVAPLVTGGNVEILAREEILDPESVLAALERAAVAFSVPSLLRRAVRGARERGPERFAGLRVLWAGGEVVTPEDAADLLSVFPATAVDVAYGPTEATIVCTTHRVARSRPPERALIGRPLPGVEARVVDPRGEPVPLGIPGELWIGGPVVARGYFCRPELTAERFVTAGGRRFYRTGDLVRQVPAEGGALEFLGRTDLQVKVRGFRIEPGEIEAALLAHPGVREAVVVARSVRSDESDGSDRSLVAYVVGASLDAAELRAFLRARLPEHMVPPLFVPLAALPLSANGKVDRRALPAPQPAREAAAGAAPPRDAREERLAGIWREVLGLERVGIHDNFFQLGGDSILSIQVVARARREGLLITARQLFEHQTIAGLAAVAESAEGSAGADQGAVEGEAPLTPIQRLFFAEERRQPERFNQAVLLIPRERLATARLAAALDHLAAHHDALRLRFLRGGEEWRQVHAPLSPVPLVEVDLTAPGPGEALGAAMEAQSGLDLARGPLLTAALFRLGGREGDRLLLTAHHLVVDGVSWRVLLEDLAAALRGRELPAKTTSWKSWAERLAAFARSPEVAAELPYWLSLPSAPPLPRDLDGDGGGVASVTAELGEAQTRALLQEVPEVYRTQVNDLLLAALARAFAAWTGEETLRVALEGHGREEIFPGADLSRTVGWLTTLFPVSLPAGGGPRESIRAVKEALRAVPRQGLSYGLLRERLGALPAPEVSFNYLGRLDSAAAAGGLFAFAPEAPRGTVAEGPLGRPLFAIDALVLDGRLRVHWTYDPGRHLAATAERLARGFVAELAALVAHCRSPEAGGYTPSDFPLAGLGQEALDRLLGRDRTVEDLYPLAPMQGGMLFHSLYTAGADLYVEQLTAEFHGPLDEAAFAAAWQRVLERHPALRTAFLWREVERPLQLVRRGVALPWTAEDWRGLPPAARELRWRDLLAADRARGFDLGRPPLLRLSLVRLDEETHRLLWSFHHLLFDGWCFSLLLSEVFTLYAAAAAGREAHLPPPPRPFRDYVAWLIRRDETATERFWRERLRGFAAPTPVPFDHPAAAGGGDGSHAGDYHERTAALPPPLAAALEALAQRLRVTLNTLVQGAWALLLSRYAQASDVVFGAVVSGRPPELPGVESMVGLFINTLPVRVEIPEGEAASAWLPRLQESQLAVSQHEWLPLARVQALAEVPPGEPLLTSLLAFENYPVDPAVAERLGELRIVDLAVVERTNYPLTLTVVARGTLSLRLTAVRRFEPATARRLLAHLETLLGALAADPERPPRDLPLLTAAERHQLTVEWNDTASPYPDEVSIPALFAAQAALRPDAPALLGPAPGDVLTYGELDARSAALAGELARQGVGRGDLVGLLAERSPELVIAILAVLRAGGAYVPLDPFYPRERLAFMLADLGAPLVLVQEGLDDRLPAGSAQTLPLVPADQGQQGQRGPEKLAAGDLAYVLYTSGSTGTPKGVAVSHRSVARLVRGAGYAAFGPDEVFLMLAPVSFDASTFELWGPLLNGGRLAIPPPGEVSLDGLERAIRDFGVTTLWLTAGLFHLVVDERLAALAPLRQLLAGGDVLSPAHAARLRRELPALRLINGYGPTESTTFTACGAVGEPAPGESVPIGRPIANSRVLVLGRDLEPVPVGVPGELYAGGAGLALGYLGRPGLTAAAFVPAPSGTAGERLYRTGDLARRLPDGRLDFLGRVDGQVKVRGFRVEPGEVEAALAAHPGLRAAAVVVPSGGDALLACVVPAAVAAPPAPEELRAFLAGRLPAYMVPAAYVTLPALPLTPQGKVDRRALARLEAARPAGAGTPPATPAERTMAALWRQILGVAEVRLEDDFFALGGQSLLATQLASRVRAAFGMEIPLRLFFEHPTLGDLTAAVMSTPGAATLLPPIPRRPAGLDPVPASFAQERLWFLERLRPGAAYNMFDALHARGELSPALLAAVLGEIVRRHEALRTTFQERAGQPVQIVAPPAGTFELPLVDLTGLPAAARLAVARRLAREESLRPFDLTRGPLLRALLLRLGATDHALLISMHHIVSDGWSVGVLMREMTALYGAARAGAPSPFPELPVQYADFAVWQREWLAGGELDRQLDYWRRRLAGAPAAIDLPLDRPRPAVPDPRGAHVSLRFSAEAAGALSRLARRRDATLFMVLLAAFQTLLLRLSGQEDLPVGSGIANRNRAEIEPLIGFFVNALVLRNDLSGDPAFDALLARVRGTTLEAYAHQDLPFERLVEELRPERNLTANPLFQVSFVLQNAPAGAMEDFPGLTLAPFDLAVAATRFDLELYAWEAGGALAMALFYATRLFDPATIQRLAGHLERLLAGVVADPEARLSALPLLAAAERHQLLREWNDTRVAAAGEFRTVAALVGAQARRAPEATALVFRGRRISYAGMDAQAGRLARRLAALGVGPEVMVGVHLERSPEMVIGALAILRAGGAYVPLDPAQPDNRLAHIAAETRMPVVLTRERGAAWAGGAVALRVDAETADAPSAAALPDPCPESTAYVIYTSGSTGRPKGVPISHAGLLNMVRLEIATYGYGPGVRMSQVMAPGFDAAAGEIWPVLAAGASLHIADEETRLSPDGLLAWAAAEGLDLCVLPTPLGELCLEGFLERGIPPGLALRALLVGGDRLKRFLPPSLPFPLVNNYGPTEATMVASLAPVERAGEEGAEPWRTPSIGRPVANTRLHVLDRALQPVPVGVAGELAIGGICLSPGYVGRPELTAAAFVPDPFSALPGERLYRTGDRVRQRPDGRLDFLARLDDQVKVRGFRIELGEIERVLERHPEVAEAAVVTRGEGEAAGLRLAAYVVPRQAPADGGGEDLSRVAQWQELYDEAYGQIVPAAAEVVDPTFDIRGWNSTYTGGPIPAEEMREWVEGTAEQLLALPHRRVLEVGCGSGLLLYRLAPSAGFYLGTDFSPRALEGIRRHLGASLPQVELRRALAHELAATVPDGLDLVILNSVVQYFPGVDYLVRVLAGAVRSVAPGGAVFVGDVRSLPLLPALAAAVELFQAPDGMAVSELRRRIGRRLADEEELAVDPEFFFALARHLPAIHRVEIRLKRGRRPNELSRFRYDVVLHVGGGEAGAGEGLVPARAEAWESMAALERLLAARPAALAVAGIPNARLAGEATALALLAGDAGIQTAGELRREAAARALPGIDPEDLRDLAGRLGYEADLTGSATEGVDGRMDAVFRRHGAGIPAGVAAEPVTAGEPTWSDYANDPLRAARARRLPLELRRFLETELPDYMIPASFAVLDALPLTAHGKVDRAALPAPERAGEPTGDWVAPATPLEELIAGVAAEVLGVERVGMRDSFFALGGHSLLATQLVSRLTQGHGVQVTLQMMFDAADFGQLADRIVEAELAGADAGLLDEALREMEGLSPAEIQELLGQAGREEEAR